MRPDYRTYFMQMATLVATRATCDRKHVGAVLVNAEKRLVSAGYNGSPRYMPHCDDVGHELKIIEGRESCVRTIHAESNALDYAGRSAMDCELFVTCIPCYDCAKRIINMGVDKVFYGEYYESRNTELVVDYFKNSGASLFQLL